jgi:hypothetical protein
MIEIQPRFGVSNAQVQVCPPPFDWIWDGAIVRGGTTLLSAPAKIGKSTLLSLLLDRRREGGELLGRSVAPGKTILCTEESLRLWSLRQPPLNFGPYLTYHVPRGNYPSRERWEQYFNELCDLESEQLRFDLLVIDTAVHFLPLSSRNRHTLRWVFATLKRIALYPAAVLVINQSRTMHRPLAAFADIVLEMSVPRGCRSGTRRRTITGVGRYPGTLQDVSAQLNAEGTDYMPIGRQRSPSASMMPTVQAVLAADEAPLTHAEIIERWPGTPPHANSLWRVLAAGHKDGVFHIFGAGTKAEPYRFGLRQS